MDDGDVVESYDRLARQYADLFMNQLDEQPIDRMLLAAFAELVLASGSPKVADLGSGPGYVTAYLASLGLVASGIDASPAMVAIARDEWPEIDFQIGDMSATPHESATFGGVVSRYGTIHSPEPDVASACEEFARLLVPGGLLLLAFHGADATDGHGEPFDHAVALAYRRHPDVVADLLHEVGLAEELRQVRQPGAGERFTQVTLLARRAGP